MHTPSSSDPVRYPSVHSAYAWRISQGGRGACPPGKITALAAEAYEFYAQVEQMQVPAPYGQRYCSPATCYFLTARGTWALAGRYCSAATSYFLTARGGGALAGRVCAPRGQERPQAAAKVSERASERAPPAR